MLQLAVSTKQVFKNLPETLVEMDQMILQARGRDLEEGPLPVPSDPTLRRHLLELDEALDCHARDRLAEAKTNKAALLA